MLYKPFWKKAGIPETSKLFEVCKDDLKGDEKYMQMVEKIFSWDFKNPASLTILSKANGCGKTMIAVCLLKKYIYELSKPLKEYCEGLVIDEMNYEQKEKIEKLERPLNKIKFEKSHNIELEILASFKKESKITEKDIIKKYCDLDFLVIDDIFGARENEFARHVMLILIDERCDWFCKPTVITSNKILDDIDDIDSRIASRIDNNYLFQISENAKDRRK